MSGGDLIYHGNGYWRRRDGSGGGGSWPAPCPDPTPIGTVRPERDPLAIALELGDKDMACAILDARGSRHPANDTRPDLYRSLRESWRAIRWERLREPAFVRGAVVGFALGQLFLLGLAIIVAKLAQHG